MSMNFEENRLRTFHSWPSNAPIDPERLARGGFFATGNDLETQCNWCLKKISDWQYGDQTMARHRRLDPLCPFVLNPTNSGNVPITSSSSPTTTDSYHEFVPIGDLKNEMTRLATYKNWPNPNISPQSLAKAGFYYLNNADRVKCAWCHGIISKWERDDNAFTEHQRFFPYCPRVQLGPLIEIASEGIRDLGIQQINPPQKPKYASLDARIRTYSRWPISDVQKPDILAQAGFYYQDIDDQVRCFHCDGGLRSWQKEDDPWFEHAKWFPHCQFLKLVKGPQYSDNVHKQVVEVNRRGAIENTNEQASEVVEQVMTLDEAMMTEPVRNALEMGLNEGRIRNATRQKLEYCGKPYQTTEELVEAVLEGQTEEGDDEDSNERSSSIVREVSRILNNIFNPRHPFETENCRNPFDSDNLQSESTSNPFDPDNLQSESTRNPFESGDDVESPTPDIVSRRPPLLNRTATSLNETLVSSSNSPNFSRNQNDTTTANSVLSSPLKENQDGKKQLSLEEENRKLKDARLCKVCMDEEVGVVFLPCGHLVTCVQCAPSVSMCPLCRSDIKGFVRTFLS